MSFQKKQVEDELPTEQIRNGKLSGVRIWHQAQSVMICDCRLRGGAEVVVGHSSSHPFCQLSCDLLLHSLNQILTDKIA